MRHLATCRRWGYDMSQASPELQVGSWTSTYDIEVGHRSWERREGNWGVIKELIYRQVGMSLLQPGGRMVDGFGLRKRDSLVWDCFRLPRPPPLWMSWMSGRLKKQVHAVAIINMDGMVISPQRKLGSRVMISLDGLCKSDLVLLSEPCLYGWLRPFPMSVMRQRSS